MNTKKVIGFKIKSKNCKVCNQAKKINLPVPNHICTKNHDRSSKAMEVDAILKLMIEFWDKKSFHMSYC